MKGALSKDKAPKARKMLQMPFCKGPNEILRGQILKSSCLE